MSCETAYVRLWEFRVRPGCEKEFEAVYGREGDWVQLFRRSNGFLCTELLCDPEINGRYVTVDYFTSKAAFDAFLAEFRQQYEALDRRCDPLCVSEQSLGSFHVSG